MTERGRETLEKMGKIIPLLDDLRQEKLLSYGEGLADRVSLEKDRERATVIS